MENISLIFEALKWPCITATSVVLGWGLVAKIMHLWNKTGQIIDLEMKDGKVIKAISGDGFTSIVYKEIYRDRCYFKHGITLDGVAAPVVLDVGGNIGLFSRWCAEYLPAGARVYCAEPIPELYQCCVANTAAHRDKVTVHNFGLFSRNTSAEFEYNPTATAGTSMMMEDLISPMYRFNQFAVCSSLLLDAAFVYPRLAWLLRPLSSLMRIPVVNVLVFVLALLPLYFTKAIYDYQSPAQKRKVTAALKTMNDMLRLDPRIADGPFPTIDLLKVDVEAAEWEVLMGISDSLWPKIRQVVVEITNIDNRIRKVQQLLTEKGFKHIVIDAEPWAMHVVFDIKTIFARRE